jgi:hypothetical protein
MQNITPELENFCEDAECGVRQYCLAFARLAQIGVSRTDDVYITNLLWVPFAHTVAMLSTTKKTEEAEVFFHLPRITYIFFRFFLVVSTFVDLRVLS